MAIEGGTARLEIVGSRLYIYFDDETWSIEGRNVGASSSTPGSFWFEGNIIRYVDANRIERELVTSSVGNNPFNRTEGDFAVSKLWFLWYARPGDQRGLPHNDHNDAHGDHSDNTNEPAHGDMKYSDGGGPFHTDGTVYINHTDHGDITHSNAPHSDETHTPHLDAHQDGWPYSDSGPHQDSSRPHQDSHGDSWPYEDSGQHEDKTNSPHEDQKAYPDNLFPVPHGDHTDYSDSGPHSDGPQHYNEPHANHTDHSDTGPHSDGPEYVDVPHADHTDYSDEPHSDIPHDDAGRPHVDGNFYQDRGHYGPHMDHADYADWSHSDYTDHSNQPYVHYDAPRLEHADSS